MIRLVTKERTDEELLELAGRFGHWFDPGTDWSYCNADYYLLGLVIERARDRGRAETQRLDPGRSRVCGGLPGPSPTFLPPW